MCRFQLLILVWKAALPKYSQIKSNALQLLKKNVNAFHVTEIILIPLFILPRPVTVTFFFLVYKIHTKLYLRLTASLRKIH